MNHYMDYYMDYYMDHYMDMLSLHMVTELIVVCKLCASGMIRGNDCSLSTKYPLCGVLFYLFAKSSLDSRLTTAFRQAFTLNCSPVFVLKTTPLTM